MSPSGNGNSGQFPFGKVGIQDNFPSGKWQFGSLLEMGFGIFGKLGFGNWDLG
jgi:hypothetical protein